jgi:hypothetical protein
MNTTLSYPRFVAPASFVIILNRKNALFDENRYGFSSPSPVFAARPLSSCLELR